MIRPHAVQDILDVAEYIRDLEERHSSLLVDEQYAVEREDGWHIATWDGECFNVTSDFQSGDRWLADQVNQYVRLTR